MWVLKVVASIKQVRYAAKHVLIGFHMNQKYQKPLPFEGPNLGRKGSSSLLRFCKNLLLHTCIMPIVNSKICGKRLFKFLATSGLVALVIYIYVTKHPCCQFARTLLFEDPLVNFDSPTNLNHTVFAISGSRNTWTNRRWYVEAWWRPNKTRGYVFMDEAPIEHLPWPSSSPPLRIPDNNSSLPTAIRMLRIIEDAFKEESKGEVRWFVMADDDTFLLVDNLMEVLSKYDHGKYFYIGMSSECVAPNWITSFEMAFGGAGFALSYPLAKSLAKNMDSCIERYHPTLLRSDHMLQSCIADLGVPLTKEKGFHQVNELLLLFFFFCLMYSGHWFPCIYMLSCYRRNQIFVSLHNWGAKIYTKIGHL